jgi:hypothetical protein
MLLRKVNVRLLNQRVPLGFDKERLGVIISQIAINTKMPQKKLSLIKTSLSIINMFTGGYQIYYRAIVF